VVGDGKNLTLFVA
jgi:hypothetical protein